MFYISKEYRNTGHLRKVCRAIDEAQKIAIFPDEFTIWEQFLKGIPYKMLLALIMDGGARGEHHQGVCGQG